MKRQFKSVKPRINSTNQCSRCGRFYHDKDITILEEGVVCLNCIDANNPQDINKMLKAGFQQEDVMTIRNIQYPGV